MQEVLRADSIGSIAATMLPESVPTLIGEVTHTFPTSFYVKTANGSLIFVTERQLRSPVTVNVDSALKMTELVSPGDQFYSSGSEMGTKQGVKIDLAQARLYKQPSTLLRAQADFAPREVAESLRLASFVLGIIDTSRSVLDPDGLSYRKVSKFARSCERLSLNSQNEGSSLYQDAFELVGAGYGFTPSGDDFLGGFLAIYNYLAPIIGGTPILLALSELLRRTPWHSAMLLNHMQHLIFDEQLNAIVATAISSRATRLVEELEGIMSRGHTSGIDISAGIVLALSLILDLKIHSHHTQKIAAYLGLTNPI